jgi:asparagine synthase (glutamine-hydrolysing)
MCGIFGHVNYNKKVSLETASKMSETLIHRGPDGEGVWSNNHGNVCLGHRRLAIIDLSDNGNQPMISKCGRFVITFNGEIYNYKELKKLLPEVGFRSETDSEVLLELFIKYGVESLNLLNGMFAFAIWDNQNNELTCARDRFGEKPFYYYHDSGEILFASEIKALWSAGVRKNINNEALFNFLINNKVENYNDRNSTFYERVQTLDVGCYMIFSESSIKSSKYYKIVPTSLNLSFDDAVLELRRLMNDSVLLRMQSDVEVGCSLSGGLDSSVIVSVIESIRNKRPFKTFTARFKDFDKDEGYFVDLLAKDKSIISNSVWIDKELYKDSFEKVCYHQDEPFSSASINAQFEVMSLARSSKVTVLLDGQGADEYFAGYFFYLNHYYRQLKHKNRLLFKKELSEYRAKNDQFWNKPLSKKRINEYPNFDLVFNKVRDRLGRNEIKELFEKNIYYQFKSFQDYQGLSLKERLLFSLFGGELQELLRYADRNSMAHSREVRLPFLDHRIVEFVMSLPDSFLIKNAYSKYLLRKSYEKELPTEIVWRKNKIGFEIPQHKWHDCNYSFMHKFPIYGDFHPDIYNKSFNISSLSLFLGD